MTKVTDEMVDRALRATKQEPRDEREVMRAALEAALSPRPVHDLMLVVAAQASFDAWSSDAWGAVGDRCRENWIKSFAAGLRAMRVEPGWGPLLPHFRRIHRDDWNAAIDRITGGADES